MKNILLFVFLSFSLISVSYSDPNVLECKQDCGIYDSKDSYTFQARMAQGEDMWGANVTFIEDDIILSSAHILGFEPNRRQTLSCGPEAAQKRNTTIIKKVCTLLMEKIILIKKLLLLKFLIYLRSTGEPPGYDILVAHVDRNCNKCNKDIKIKPIPIANNLPTINTKAIHIAVPGNSQMNKGRFFDNHLLNGRIWGGKNNACSRQTIKHDGKHNPAMVFDTSGSPVIFKECGKYSLMVFMEMEWIMMAICMNFFN